MATKSFIKRLLFVGTSFAAMSLASVGQAGTLVSAGPLFGDPVTISYNGSTEGTSAGAFVAASFDGVPIPDFWCIDLNHTVPYPPWTIGNYTQADFQSAPLTFTSTQVSNLETLFFDYYSASLFTSTDNAAAFQLAIWDLLFDNDGSLSTYGGVGTFGVVSGSIAPGVITVAQSEIDAVISGTQHPYSLTQLTSSAGNQNFVYPGPPRETVPEPTGLALFGAGLVAMMFIARRRKTNGQFA